MTANNNIITAPGFYQDYCDDKCEVLYIGKYFALGLDAGGHPARWDLETGKHHNNAGYHIIAPWVEPVPPIEWWIRVNQWSDQSIGFDIISDNRPPHKYNPGVTIIDEIKVRYDSSKPKGQRLSEVMEKSDDK
jgi:hypothetical protein